MRMSIYSFVFLLVCLTGHAQNGTIDQLMANAVDLHEVNHGDQNFEGFEKLKEILAGVEIIALGEQTHFDGTTLATKVKLVQYLHSEMGFDILLFESGFYDCDKAWRQITEGEEVGIALGKTLPNAWALPMQAEPLLAYIDSTANSERPLQIMGMDYQLSYITAREHYLEDLRRKVGELDIQLLNSESWLHLEATVGLLFTYNWKDIRKREIQNDKDYIDILITKFGEVDDGAFWMQVLQNLKLYLDDWGLNIDTRDKAMAENLIWIKEHYPNKKIICWGATRHFLYNSEETKLKNPLIRLLNGWNFFDKHPCMGNFAKEKYGDAFYTIGFSTYGGSYGFGGATQLKDAKKRSIEYAIAQSDFDNCLIPLRQSLDGYIARPLGHMYTTNDISRVMDALIFNREMEPLYINRALHQRINPEYYLAKEE